MWSLEEKRASSRWPPKAFATQLQSGNLKMTILVICSCNQIRRFPIWFTHFPTCACWSKEGVHTYRFKENLHPVFLNKMQEQPRGLHHSSKRVQSTWTYLWVMTTTTINIASVQSMTWSWRTSRIFCDIHFTSCYKKTFPRDWPRTVAVAILINLVSSGRLTTEQGSTFLLYYYFTLPTSYSASITTFQWMQ